MNRNHFFTALLLLFSISSKAQTKLDTTKIIMLVSDTSKTQTDHGTYWQRGWIVKRFVPAGWGDFDRQIFPHWEEYKFLDNLKFDIPEYWIVWKYVDAK